MQLFLQCVIKNSITFHVYALLCAVMTVPEAVRMLFTYPAILCLIIQVQAYVLLQVRKDEQNRSNVDALIHKVIPSEQFDKFAKKIARKQFAEKIKKQHQGYDKRLEPVPFEQNSQLASTHSGETKVLKRVVDVVNKFMSDKPVLRSKSFKISPVANFRSQPSLVYELDSSTLVRAIKDFLSSALVTQYTDDVAKKAAIVYRTLHK